jgi:hypothetical protein
LTKVFFHKPKKLPMGSYEELAQQWRPKEVVENSEDLMDGKAKLRDAIEDVKVEGVNDSSTFGVVRSEVLHADSEGGEHFDTLLEGTPIPKTMREVKPHDREAQQMRLVHRLAREHPIYRSVKQEGIVFASGVHDG